MPRIRTILGLAVAAATAAVLAGPAAQAAQAPVVFEDPADDTGGPDLTRIAVGNTAQALVLDLRIPNRAAGLDVLDTITLYADVDGDAGTGDPLHHGADRLIEVTGGASGPVAWRARWDSGAWTLPAVHAGVAAAWSAPDLRITASLDALGDPTATLEVSLVAVQTGINPDPNTDHAPDAPGTAYAYTLGSGSPPPAPGAAPNTHIVAGPSGVTGAHRAAFRFRSTKPGSTFRCRLDARPWHRCSSPRIWHRLAPGRHVFRVAARDADGRLDPTPAARVWRIR